jgi:S-formylglutathione hydrolase
LREACDQAGQALTLNKHEGYDHSYFFVGTFIGQHLKFHTEALAR